MIFVVPLSISTDISSPETNNSLFDSRLIVSISSKSPSKGFTEIIIFSPSSSTASGDEISDKVGISLILFINKLNDIISD